jgi:hypothetical protein
MLKKDHSWVIRVRRYSDDPFGPVIHEERVADPTNVKGTIQRLEKTIHDGGLGELMRSRVR